MSQIKINRAAKMSALGKFPRAWATVIAAIPQSLIASATSKQIAALADAMRAQYEAGHSAGFADAKS